MRPAKAPRPAHILVVAAARFSFAAEIVVAVDVPEHEQDWPVMGLTIRRHEIIDGLQREFLPPEFADLHYPGGRPGTGYD